MTVPSRRTSQEIQFQLAIYMHKEMERQMNVEKLKKIALELHVRHVNLLMKMRKKRRILLDLIHLIPL